MSAPISAPAWDRMGATLAGSKALNHYPQWLLTSGMCGVQAPPQVYILKSIYQLLKAASPVSWLIVDQWLKLYCSSVSCGLCF